MTVCVCAQVGSGHGRGPAGSAGPDRMIVCVRRWVLDTDADRLDRRGRIA